LLDFSVIKKDPDPEVSPASILKQMTHPSQSLFWSLTGKEKDPSIASVAPAVWLQIMHPKVSV
jgi:hypothetical protein